MAIMTRIGQKVLDQLGNDENAEFIKCLHAKKDVNPDDRYIVQFHRITQFGQSTRLTAVTFFLVRSVSL